METQASRRAATPLVLWCIVGIAALVVVVTIIRSAPGGFAGDGDDQAARINAVSRFAATAGHLIQLDAAAKQTLAADLKSGDAQSAYNDARATASAFLQYPGGHPDGFNASGEATSSYAAAGYDAYKKAADAINDPGLASTYDMGERLQSLNVYIKDVLSSFKNDLAHSGFPNATRQKIMRHLTNPGGK